MYPNFYYKVFLFLLLILTSLIKAQGWVGTNGNLYCVNPSLNLNPINVGIGTSFPSAQLHTTDNVRFEGLYFHDVENLVGIDTSGYLYKVNVSNIQDNWKLDGNIINTDEFIGTINSKDFRIRTNNTQNMVVSANGNVGIGRTSINPSRILDIRYKEQLPYSSTNGIRNGLFVYNDFETSDEYSNQTASITLAARGGGTSDLSVALITGEVTKHNSMDIVFQNEYSSPTVVRENMRINYEGNVGIGTNKLITARLHIKGNVRFEDLPSGTGDVLVIDSDGYVYRSSSSLKNEINKLKEELSNIKELVKQLIKEV